MVSWIVWLSDLMDSEQAFPGGQSRLRVERMWIRTRGQSDCISGAHAFFRHHEIAKRGLIEWPCGFPVGSFFFALGFSLLFYVSFYYLSCVLDSQFLGFVSSLPLVSWSANTDQIAIVELWLVGVLPARAFCNVGQRGLGYRAEHYKVAFETLCPMEQATKV